MKNNKKVLIFIVLIILFLSIVFFIKNYYKNMIIGNNISSKSTQEIVDNILNMKSKILSLYYVDNYQNYITDSLLQVKKYGV